MNSLTKFVLDRAKERSTWVGLIGMLSVAGVAIKPEMMEAIVSFGVALSGLVLAVTKDMAEKKNDNPK